MQDWTPVTLTKSTHVANAKANEKKYSKIPEHVAMATKLDQATDPSVIEKMPRNIVVQLVAGRVAKKLSQKQLATNLNIPVKTIQDIESHKHAKDMKLAQRIARSLGCVLVK